MLNALGRILAALILGAGILMALRGEAGIRPELLDAIRGTPPSALSQWIEARIETGDWNAAAAGYARLAGALSVEGRTALAAATLSTAADALERIPEPSAEQRALVAEHRLNAAWHYLDLHQPAAAQQELQRLQPTDVPVLKARLALIAGRAALQRGNPSAAAHWADQVLTNDAALAVDQATARVLRAEIELLTGDAQEAARMLDLAADHWDRGRDTRATADARRMQARALLQADDPLAAERAIRRGMAARARLADFGDDARDRRGELRDRAQLADIHAYQGRLESAERLAMQNVAELRLDDDHVLMADSLFRLGLIRALQGDALRASGHFERAVVEINRADALTLRPMGLLNLALAEMGRERTDAAEAWLLRTVADGHRMNQPLVTDRARAALLANEHLALLLELREAAERDEDPLVRAARQLRRALMLLTRIVNWSAAVPESFYAHTVTLLDGCAWREGGLDLPNCDAL